MLKSCGIDSHHKQFRPFLQQLFKVCSKQWLEQLCTEVKTSTSEAMRALVMKHKSTVLKLKSTSPKNSTKNKDYIVSKQKSVSDVKKVLFIDSTPKFEFNFENVGPDFNNVTKKVDNVAVFLGITKVTSNKNIEDEPSRSISSTSNYSTFKIDF